MATRVRETERKYEAGVEFVLPDLTAAGPVHTCDGPQRSQLDATYFDTADLRLARAGITLRRRTGGSDAGWHAKLPVGPDVRDEIRFPLGKGKSKVPADLAVLVRAHTLGAPLAPVVRITTERDEWELKAADGTVVALLADDRVTAHPVDDEPRQWRELEVEATDRTVLDAVGSALGARPAKSTSKLARALGKRAKVRVAVALSADPTAAEVVLLYLRAQVDALRANDTGVRLDTEDAVHQFRVACRRLRSALRSFRPLLDRDRVTALRAELKWLGGEASAARDTEVLEAELRAELARVPSVDVLGAVPARITAELGRAAADGRAAVLSAVDGDRYLALLADLDAFLADPPWTPKADRPAALELRKPVRKAWQALADSVDAVGEAAAGTDRDTALHQARKDAKKARYTAEAVAPVFGGKLEAWRDRVKAAQTALGTHQDAVVAKAALRDLGVRAHLDGDNGFTYGLLHARQDARAHAAEAEFAKAWKRLRGSKAPRWLR
ncbi:CYTH and CHAD domain-containing protein [Actinokineospora sp. NBRC 105648]|uniref:CYTH and CHAD domain-containing protein n=1 Tax=Actinokineospora sp. NBRC 105648 TaxID=3032206 RepID=UPI0024A27542|nr:CYTH and CHAD domain-containing protein [Actinokineospora sp. NBRC 105648]GLZ38847.1 CHAD domain-containing protein [Actinokineospora sp. NBRC 105648]